MKELLVSIIMPNYNNEKYLARSVKSVIDQSYQNWELIVIDNRSSDNSLKVLQGFNDKRIKIFTTDNEGIIGKSRNIGLKNSNGEWLSFLDSDDWWEPKKLEEIFKIINSSDYYDVVVHNEYKIDDKNNQKHILKYGPYEKNFYEKLIIFGNRISLSAATVRKSFLKYHKIIFSERRDHITAEDYDLWINIANNDGKFYFCKKILGNYFIHQNNQSIINNLHFNNIINVSLHYAKLENNKNYYSKIISRKYLLFALSNFLNINSSIYFFKSLRFSPFYILLFISNKIKCKFYK